jgi:5-hydroxyisourate hydrolase
MGRLSTHVLDTANGKPAEGVMIRLYRLAADGVRDHVVSTTTNADGRTDMPLLAGEAYAPGSYEIEFHVGAYFMAAGTLSTETPFLDIVPVRFTMSEADGHYHVPLLASPYGYTTYRGS